MRYLLIHISNFIQIAALFGFVVFMRAEFAVPTFCTSVLVMIPLLRIIKETTEITDAVHRARKIKALRK